MANAQTDNEAELFLRVMLNQKTNKYLENVARLFNFFWSCGSDMASSFKKNLKSGIVIAPLEDFSTLEPV